jgi:ligand-binding sensor domain-containing protein
LYRWKAGELTNLGRAEGLAADEISDLQPAKDGGLWIVSAKLQRLLDPEVPLITTVQDVPREGIFSAYEDREGSVWLCAKERGLMRAGLMPYRLISTRDGLPDDSARSMSEDPAGNLWLAAQSYGVIRVTPDGVATTPFAGSDDRSSPRPVAILAARTGQSGWECRARDLSAFAAATDATKLFPRSGARTEFSKITVAPSGLGR